MGWWRIDGPSGHVDWTSRGDDGAVLENHIPGMHSPENHYNGDETVDLLDKVVSTMLDRFTDYAYKDAARKAFIGEPVEPDAIDLIHKQSLELARQKIERVYKREWGRPAYDEELRGTFEFCTAFIQQKSK